MFNQTILSEKLKKMGDAMFHRLCSALVPFFFPEIPVGGIVDVGIHLTKTKSRSGTPDAFFQNAKDNIIAFQYTTIEKGLKGKFQEDIAKTISWKLGDKVERVVIMTNHPYSEKILLTVFEANCRPDLNVQIIWLGQILALIVQNYSAKIKAEKILDIVLPDQIGTPEDLMGYYSEIYASDMREELRNNYHQSLLNLDLYDLPIPIESVREKAEFKCDAPTNGMRVLLLGDAGSGKSTFLMRLFFEQSEKKDWISVLITLNDYGGKPLGELIKQQLERDEHIISYDLIDHLLRKGSFYLMLDGLDEIPLQFQRDLLKELNDHRFQRNAIILSSREECDSLVHNCFERCRITKLTPELVTSFLEKTFHSIPSATKQVLTEKFLSSRILSNPFNLVVASHLALQDSRKVELLISSSEQDFSILSSLFGHIWQGNDIPVYT